LRFFQPISIDIYTPIDLNLLKADASKIQYNYLRLESLLNSQMKDKNSIKWESRRWII
jgi:hypothetical protein